ncbi:MAG: hypothetical protein M3417_04920, partial [Actinomycetota bacterium]|nr:hypothetical protein [Actinomycetota bacterium]
MVKLGAGATEPANTCRPFDVAVSLWAGARLVAGLLCVAVLPVLPRSALLLCTSGSLKTDGSRKVWRCAGREACGTAAAGAADWLG